MSRNKQKNTVQRPRVSILVASYNVENWLPECLESVQNQTFTAFECIIVDDCSTDSSASIASQFCEKDKRFKLIRHPFNQGLPQARRTGYLNTSGDYIWYIDGDDLVTNEGLEAIVKMMDRDGCEIGRGRYQSLENGDLSPKNMTANTPAFSNCSYKQLYTYVSPNSLWLNIFKREFLQENPIPFFKDLNLGEDLIYCAHAFTNAKSISVTDRTIYTYRSRAESYTKSGSAKRRYLEEAKSHLLCFNCLKKFPVVALDFLYRLTALREKWVKDACRHLPQNEAIDVIKTYKSIYSDGFDHLGYALVNKNRAIGWAPNKNRDVFLFGTLMKTENAKHIFHYYRA